MRNLKRVLSLAMALVMVLGMMVITTNAADFTDAEEITYKEAVEVMSQIGIIKGYPNADGSYTFNPEGELTRAQAAKIMAFVMMGLEADDYLTGASDVDFTDVAADHWAVKYIAFCQNAKIIDGNGDNTYNPDGAITTVQFGKLLLGALNIKGEYTGPNWAENIKTALEDNGLDVVTIDNSNITREEACHMALAAMKFTTTSATYYVTNQAGTEIVGAYSTQMEADLKVAELNAIIANVAKVVKVEAADYLLNKFYDFTFERTTDDFGRPGVEYTNGLTGADEVTMFYADKALATFEGPAAEQAIFAATGEKKLKAISYTMYQDGVTDASWTFVADKAGELTADHFAAGTGYGIKSELYQVGTVASPAYRLVAIRDYMGVVTAVNPADEENPLSKRSIEIAVVGIGANNSEDGVCELETEEFALNDVVIVNVAGDTVKSIALAEAVSGVATKIVDGSGTADNKYYTIGGETYVKSQNAADFDVVMNGEEAMYVVDSMGNLIYKVTPEEVPTVYYGILLDTDALQYIEAVPGTILGKPAKEGQEANEVIKILTAEGKEVLYTTAWEYEYNTTTGKVDSVTYINGSFSGTTYVPTVGTAGTLVAYTLDENGKIDDIDAVGIAGVASGNLKTGKATLGAGYTKVVTDKTLFFVKVTGPNVAQPKYVAYTGYKTVPNVDIAKSYVVNGKIPGTNTDDGTYAIVVIEGTKTPAGTVKVEDNYIYFAGTECTAEWDATAKNGKGAIVYIYENVYLNGEKTTVTFAAKQTKAVKGAMYKYTVNATTGALSVNYNTNLLVGTDKVTLIHEDFIVAGGVNYVDANTVYYQITKTGLAKVEALPTVKASESIVVKYIIDNYDEEGNVTTANTVFFEVFKTSEIPAVVAVDSAEELIAAAADEDVETIVLTADVELEETLVLDKVVTLDGNGYTITSSAAQAITTVGGTIKNLTLEGTSTYGIHGDEDAYEFAANLVLNNVTATEYARPMTIGGFDNGAGTADHKVIATNCEFAGKLSWSEKVFTEATFTNCAFGASSRQEIEFYTDATFTNCEFEDGFILNFEDQSALEFVVKVGDVTYTNESSNYIFGAI